jgi:hypothetical protein
MCSCSTHLTLFGLTHLTLPVPGRTFCPAEEEKAGWQLLPPEERPAYVPQAFDCLRHVPLYSDFIKERFERCLDLYLCPRCVTLLCFCYVMNRLCYSLVSLHSDLIESGLSAACTCAKVRHFVDHYVIFCCWHAMMCGSRCTRTLSKSAAWTSTSAPGVSLASTGGCCWN